MESAFERRAKLRSCRADQWFNTQPCHTSPFFESHDATASLNALTLWAMTDLEWRTGSIAWYQVYTTLHATTVTLKKLGDGNAGHCD
jgi:hypothetical protein